MSERLLIAILAAGASRRLGQPKQLVDIGGEPLLRRQCRVALESAVAPVAVVLGCHADACAATIADLPVTIRVNHEWEEGLASSLREAVRAAVECGVGGLLILHADQYGVTAEDIKALNRAWADAGGMTACRARHGEYAGPPAILPSGCFSRLLQVRGDEGARQVLSPQPGTRSPIDVPMAAAADDLDVPEQLISFSKLC
jgi:molybdenum cofactor cytidylyltransferase